MAPTVLIIVIIDVKEQYMRIAVTTPTGNVGRHVVAMLIRAGVRPLVLARDPARLDAAVHAETDVLAVDQRDPAAVAAATSGVDALFWVDPPSHGDDPLADYQLATDAVERAVRQNGIDRVVFQSSVGAEQRHGAGEIDGLARTEEALDATGVAVVHLRCGFFFSNLEQLLDAVRAGTIPVILPLDQPLAWVAPRDIAEVAVGWLLAPGWSGRHLRAVHGPTDLTWPQAAAIVSAATGRHVGVERITDAAMRAILLDTGMSERAAEAVLGMSTGLRDGFVQEVPRTPTSTTPSTLGSWAYDTLRPLLGS